MVTHNDDTDKSLGTVLFVDDEESILKSSQRSVFLAEFKVKTGLGANDELIR